MTRKTGKKTEEFLKISKKYEPDCMNWQAPVVWDHAKGAEIWDVDGNHFVDWTSGVLVTNIGHAHPHLAEALSTQAKKLLNTYDFPTPERLELSRRIVELTPSHLNKVLFVSTGSEATDAAIRTAKRHTNKFEILSFWGGFHGRSYGPMSVSGSMNIKRNFGPLVPGNIFAPYPYCYRCPFNKNHPECDFFCLKYLDGVVAAESTNSLAGLIIEPYQGAAGFIFPPEGYMQRLEKWARDNGLIFILDEVQSSYGRTGKMCALEHEDLEPDILCIGKGMGSGVPIAAMVARESIMTSLETGEMSSTLGGNPLSCAGALAVLDIIEHEKLVERAEKTGLYLYDLLLKLKMKYSFIGDVRGKGLVYGIEFVKDRESKEPASDLAKEIVLKCVEKGLMVGKLGLHGNVMRVAPPLVITLELIDSAVAILDDVFSGL